MADHFIVEHRDRKKKEDNSVVTTIRMERTLQEAFDRLAAQSEHSRNALMCMALQYALDHLEFIPPAE